LDKAPRTFEPLPDIPMDKSFTLDQLTGRFQGVRDGVPELVKNSKDHYSRLSILDKAQRQIVVLISPDNRRLGVLDFGGATEKDFEGWREWSSRWAGRAELGADIEAGYGNGGKSFMVRGSLRESYMVGYSGGYLTKMGFQNDDLSLRFRPGWYADERGTIKSLKSRNVEEELTRELQQFGLHSFKQLPPPAQQTFKNRGAFTLVVVDGVKDWVNARARESLARRLPFELASHPQAALTVESCSVWVMRGSQVLQPGVLQPEILDPLPDFEEPRRISVPDQLVDARTKERVSAGPGEKFLEIRTSRKALRIGDNRALNVIRVRNDRNIVANWPVSELAPMASSTFVFGTLQVPAIKGDQLSGAERQALADTPLVRALREWTETNLAEICQEIQQAQASREKPEDRDTTNDALRKLRELMRQFLKLEGGADGLRQQYGSIVHEIVLEPGKSDLTIPAGSVVPLVFKCYERDGDRRLPILKPKVHLVADPVGIVSFNGFSSISTLSPGKCRIRLEDQHGTVRSNEITINSMAVPDATIEAPDRELKQGEIVQLDILALDENAKPIHGAIYEIGLDELDLGRVGRTGVFTAGGESGAATIHLKFSSERESTCKVTVGPEKIERNPPSPRSDIPLLLLCGTTAPGREDLPEAQRTWPPSPSYPTIIDYEPQWENVVWINLQSPEAEKVRGSRGPTGAMGIKNRTVYQFLALKTFEVLRRLKVRQEFEEKQAYGTEVLQVMSQMEVDAAAFLDKAYKIVDEMLEGVELSSF
jgi:hypothetical protein